jgi:prevent-host-death family protein
VSTPWQLQDAKARFSEVVKRAAGEGPQVITYRGIETAVVLSIDDFRRLEASRPSLAEYLMTGPRLDDEVIALINDRPGDDGREIDL